MSAKLVEVVRLNGSRAGRHDRFSSRRPVGGEVFYLDSPFIEPTTHPLIYPRENAPTAELQRRQLQALSDEATRTKRFCCREEVIAKLLSPCVPYFTIRMSECLRLVW